ncbi:hypothetical protein [Mycobacterium sp.]|uniref:hypothetical protein n=1 Tax=Mycobacterium sp. TaxID=1785 RepID=UPI003F99094D
MSVNTVADSMRRQGLAGRKPKRRRGLTRSAAVPNQKWCGDITDVPTDENKLHLSSVLDLSGRRLLRARCRITRTPS